MLTRLVGAAIGFAAVTVLPVPGESVLAQGLDLNSGGASVKAAPGVRTLIGPADPSQDTNVIVWMKMRDQPAFEQAVAQLYNPESSTYRKWMSTRDLAAFQPTTAQLATVRAQLQSHGLETALDPNGLFVKAHGSAAQVQRAFHTAISTFRKGEQVFNANVSPAVLDGAAGELMLGVSGLDAEPHVHPMLVRQADIRTGEPWVKQLASTSPPPLSSFVTNQCFQPATTIQVGSVGSLPNASYTGNAYSPGGLPCGYTPAQLQAAYGLTDAYAQGLRGDGQTIVIIDAFGSANILQDANTFSAAGGLPPLTSSNFQIVYPDGQPKIANSSWAIETTLDVEWAHAVAPNANIVLVVTPGQGDQEFQVALNYAITHKLGGVISNSYGAPEYAYGAHTQAGYEQQFMLAAAMGISVHFASGDSADFQLNTPVGAATYPASSPYVTAVGGTSLGIPNGNGGIAEVGWGEHRVVVNSPITGAVSDPPTLSGVSGSGGGESLQFAKPSWQSTLPGTGRQTPDIAALADPATGVPIVFSAPTPLGTIQELEIVGGTSLASPLFSGIWTLANQKAGTWLGQAAPAIARMPSTALNDIVPIGSETNVTGTVVDAGGTHLLSANTIAAPLFGVTSFFSAIITPTTNSPQPLLITFGTDQSLTITPGWDNVTGFGSPRGLPFITAAAAGQ